MKVIRKGYAPESLLAKRLPQTRSGRNFRNINFHSELEALWKDWIGIAGEKPQPSSSKKEAIQERQQSIPITCPMPDSKLEATFTTTFNDLVNFIGNVFHDIDELSTTSKNSLTKKELLNKINTMKSKIQWRIFDQVGKVETGKKD